MPAVTSGDQFVAGSAAANLAKLATHQQPAETIVRAAVSRNQSARDERPVDHQPETNEGRCEVEVRAWPGPATPAPKTSGVAAIASSQGAGRGPSDWSELTGGSVLHYESSPFTVPHRRTLLKSKTGLEVAAGSEYPQTRPRRGKGAAVAASGTRREGTDAARPRLVGLPSGALLCWFRRPHEGRG